MRLPQAIDLGVQSLGRQDVSAPARLAMAENQAEQAWVSAFNKATEVVAEVAAAEEAADGKLTLSERIIQDKKTLAEMQAYLESTNALDLTAEDLPDAIRDIANEYAKQNGLTGNIIPTAEVAMSTARRYFDDTREASFEALSKFTDSEALQAAYNDGMGNVWANSVAAAKKIETLQRMQNLKAKADSRVSAAINSLNAADAHAIILEAGAAGVYTPEEVNDKIATVTPTVNYIDLHGKLIGSMRQADIDLVEDEMDSKQLTPEHRIKLQNLIDQRQNHLHTLHQRQQEVTYGEGHDLLINGKLTREWISDKLTHQEISGSQANVLRNALDTPPAMNSDPRVLDGLKREIVLLRRPDDGDTPLTISNRAKKLRERLMTAYTGVGPNGLVDRSITGDDLDTLMKMVDEYENTALGKGGQRYMMAQRNIKALTGYSDQINKMIEGPYPAGQAYAAFSAALQDHMDVNGYEADPQDFIDRNAARFTADVYSAKLGDRLKRLFPQYADRIDMAAPHNILYEALADMMNGKLSRESYRLLYRNLQYSLIENNVDTSELSGDTM